MITLIKAPKNYYSEIFQSISVLFAFVTKKDDVYTQLFAPVKCRDFLGDCIWSKKTGNNVDIYGFCYYHENTPYDKDMLRLSLTFPQSKPEALKNFFKNFEELDFLSTKERLSNAEYSKILLTEDPLTIIIEADPIWMSNTWKLSLFTFYLKLMCYEDTTQVETPENEYLEVFTPEIEQKMLDNLNNMEENISSSMYETHNSTGFFSIIKKHHKGLNWSI